MNKEETFMKTRAYILAAFAVIATASCNIMDNPAEGFSVNATIEGVSSTKLDYQENADGIKPEWKVGDCIFGYDDCGREFSFSISSVTDGTATVNTGDYTPGTAKFLYAAYYPGKGVSDIVEEAVAVDLSSQSGTLDTDFPLIMTATGRIRGGNVSLAFKVESAIIGIRQIKVPGDAGISRLVVTGVRTSGEINSIHGMTEVAPDKETGSVEVAYNGAPVFISVLPAPDAQIGLTAIADDGTEYAVQTSIPETTIEAGNYYYTSKEMGECVAEIIETGELFADIHQAVERVNSSKLDSVTLKLRKEVSITDSLVLENGNGCLIKIDFNGHTITGGAEGHNLIRVRNNAVFEDNSPEGDGGVSVTIANKYTRAVYFNWNDCYLHVKGGRYSSRSESGVFYFRGMHSEIIFYGGTVENTRSAGGSAVYIYGSTGIGGTINGGVFINRNGGTYAAISNNASAELEVNGGYFHNGTSTGKPVTNAIVSKGYFNKAIEADMLASGSSCTPETTVHEGLTYNYTVDRNDVVAEIVETGDVFADIHQAVDFVNASEADAITLKLRKNVSITDSLVLQNVKENLITIDFNGHTITNDVKGHNTIRIKNKNVVFEDNSPEGNGGVSNEYANIYSRAVYVLWDDCNLTIKGGHYSAKSENGAIYFRGIGSKLTFSGGTVENLRSAGGSAVYVYGSSKIGGTINGGVFINRNGGSYAAVSYHGTAKLVVNGGYFHNGSSTGNPVTSATVYGGFFSKELPIDLVASGHSCKMQTTEYGGLTYNYVVE